MSCHETGPADDAPLGSTATATPRVVLVGNPNVGKSTLFNAVTGAHQRTMNAPGTTVHWELGHWRSKQGPEIELVDLPGAASLVALSPDEQVTADALTGHLGTRPDLAVVVADASALERSLYLLAQVADTGIGVVVALTMNDVAAARGTTVDAAALSDAIGVPVVAVDPRLRQGLADLADAVVAALGDPPRLETGTAPAQGPDTDLTEHLRDVADAHFDWVADVDARIRSPRRAHTETWSDRLDRVLLNPWCGVPVFLAIMWAVFQLTTTVAAPLQDWLDWLIGDRFGALLSWLLGFIGLEGSWFEGFLVDGVVAGIATVATFIPPMGIMFLALSVLEDSGYIARAGFVMDRVMRVIGLDGRAFLPLVIGFGCNLPALAATRTLPNARQRLLTGLLIPLSSCTARLTVFVVMANVFFPAHAGTAVFAMYVTSVLLIIGGGLVLRRTVFRDLRSEPFVLALPAYQRPRLGPMGRSVVVRTRDFVIRAGRVIIATLVLMWVLLSVPVNGGTFGEVDVEDSAYGTVSAAIAPAFAPAGYDDWHASSALVTGFFAKEVVVGALAQSYAVDEPEDPDDPGDLTSRLYATFDESSGGAPGAAAAAFMVFVLAYTPCAATVAEQRRHFGWKPALAAVGASLLLAWVLSVVVFQVGRLL